LTLNMRPLVRFSNAKIHPPPGGGRRTAEMGSKKWRPPRCAERGDGFPGILPKRDAHGGERPQRIQLRNRRLLWLNPAVV
jgi:hypothetical protein